MPYKAFRPRIASPVYAFIFTCATLAQNPDLKSASGYSRMVEKQVGAWIVKAAEKMPEQQYAFKPDPASRSFGEMIGHRRF